MTSLYLSSTDSLNLSVPAALICSSNLGDATWALPPSAHSKISEAHKKNGNKASRKTSKNILTGLYGVDLTLKIFSFLDARNLCTVAAVASHCNRISQKRLLWNIPQGIKFSGSKIFTPKIKWFILNPEYKTDCVTISNLSKERLTLAKKVVPSSNWQKIKSNFFLNQLILSISSMASLKLLLSSGEDQTSLFYEDSANPSPFFLTFFSFGMLAFFNFSSRSDQISPLLIVQKCTALGLEILKKSTHNRIRDKERLVVKIYS